LKFKVYFAPLNQTDMKKLFLLLFATVSIATLFNACNNSKSGGGDAVDLKLNLKKGETYTYNMKMNMNMASLSDVNMDFGFKMKVDDVDAQNNFAINCFYDAIRFKVSALGKDMGYDSKNVGDTTHENPQDKIFRKIFGSMVGQSFKMTMSPKGEVLKVEGLKDLIESMTAGMDIPEGQKEQMKQQMSQSFSEDQMKQTFSQGFSVFPDKPVKVGDSWKKNVSKTTSGIAMNQEVTYTVKEINANSVMLSLSGDIKSSKDESGATAAKIEDMSGDLKGTMELDRTSGMVHAGNMDMNMKVKAMGQNMDMKMKITIEGK